MKKIMFVMFVCSFTAAIFAQEKSNTIRENDQIESPEQVKIEQISKIQQNNAANTVVSYDFTTSSSQYFGGTDACVDLSVAQDGSGPWGMIAGETNSSGVITNADKDIIDSNIDVTGYLEGDTNLSGVVTNADKDFIDKNIDRTSQVPN